MPTEYTEPVEVEGGFADLGLDSPTVVAPTDFPVGVHRGFVSDAKFVQNKTDATKKNLVLEYKVHEPGSKIHGKTKVEYKPANATDSDVIKGYLKGRLNNLGVSDEEMGSLNVKTLKGTPVYFTVAVDRKNPEQTRIVRVALDNDNEAVSGVSPEPDVSGAVDSSDLGY